MSSANVEGMLREGVNALKAGRRDEARALLLRAVELDQYNEEAWLWLSGVLDGLEDQRTALENALSINPQSERARQGLDYINKQLGISGPSAGSGTIATSVEWGDPSAPPSSNAPEHSPEILDKWVTNLNINPNSAPPGVPTSSGAPPMQVDRKASAASPFGDVDFGDEDDLFASGPFRADDQGLGQSEPPGLTPAQRAQRTAQRRAKSEARRTSTPKGGALVPTITQEAETDMMGIPVNIAPTRMPGTIERVPVLLNLGVFLMVIVNLAAAVMFMNALFA